MGVRGRMARLIDGGASTNETLRRVDALTVELRALQDKVDALQAAQLDDFDSIRQAVAVATDDLVARVQAIDERSVQHG